MIKKFTKQKQPTVSVIVPIYNAEKYLKKCLDSITHQTLEDIEIICVDDGSTDATPQIIKKYSQSDPRIKIISQKNINAGAARNHGLKYATGRYLSFLDADDFFEPDMLKTMVTTADKNSLDIVVVGSDLYLDDKKQFTKCKSFVPEKIPKERFFRAQQIEGVFSAFVGWPWDKLFSSKFIQDNQIRFQEQKSTNDLFFVYSALVKANRIAVVHQILAHHRRNVSSSISVNREKSYQCARDALIALRRQLEVWGVYEQFQRDFLNYAVEHSLWQLDSLSYPTQKKFFKHLKEHWMHEYGLTANGVSASLFYNPDHYQRLQSIINGNYEENLICRAEIDESWLEKSDAYSTGLIQQNKELKKSLQLSESQNRLLQSQIDALTHSKSFRIGKAVTSPIRAIQRIRKK